VEAFRFALRRGDVREAKSIAEIDPGFHNKQDEEGYTGLMAALTYRCHSLSRWLLSQPGLDTSLSSAIQAITALHCACLYQTPLDIVIILVRLSSPETINKCGLPGLIDTAIKNYHTTTALHLCWLGLATVNIETNEEVNDVNFYGITLQTWIDAGCRRAPASRQDTLFWAIAANVR